MYYLTFSIPKRGCDTLASRYIAEVPAGYKSVGGSQVFFSKHYRDIKTGKLKYSFYDASPFTESSRRIMSGISDETGSKIIDNFERSRMRSRAVNTAYLSSLQGKSELRRRTYEGLDKAFNEYSSAEKQALLNLFDEFELEDWNDFVKNYTGDDYFTDWWTHYHRYETNRMDSGYRDINSEGKPTNSFSAQELAEKMITYLKSIGKLPEDFDILAWELSVSMYESVL